MTPRRTLVLACLLVAVPAAAPALAQGPQLTVSGPATTKPSARGSLSFAVVCPPTAAEACEGTAMLRAGRGKRLTRIGASSFTAAPGATVTVRVRLTNRGAKLLERKRELAATLGVTVRDAVGAGPSRTLELKVRRR